MRTVREAVMLAVLTGLCPRPAAAHEPDLGRESNAGLHPGLSLRVGGFYNAFDVDPGVGLDGQPALHSMVGAELSVEYEIMRDRMSVGAAIREDMLFCGNMALPAYALPLIQARVLGRIRLVESGRPFVQLGVGLANMVFADEPDPPVGIGYQAALGWMIGDGGTNPGWFAEVSLEETGIELPVPGSKGNPQSVDLRAALLVLGYLW